jgi:arylsulfatase A-like enzyme
MNAFANATRTLESIPNLMLSLHTQSHGVVSEYARVMPEFETMAESFNAAGFATASFVTNVNAGPRNGLDQGFDSFFDHIELANLARDDRTIPLEDVMAWMKRHADRPTFLYVHTAEPHSPFKPPDDFPVRFDPDSVPTTTRDGVTTAHPPQRGEKCRLLTAAYDAEIAYADSMVGRFRDAMREAGMWDDCLFVLTSDHGEEFFEHGRLYHGNSVFSELVRVPLVMSWPTAIEPIGRIDENAQLIDVLPTLLEINGLESSMPMQGRSLAPLLSGQSDEAWRQRAILCETYMRRPTKRALIQGSWKLVHSEGGKEARLYNMQLDPREMEDVAMDHPRIVENLKRRMATFVEFLPRYAPSDDERQEISKEHLERLRALGYLD